MPQHAHGFGADLTGRGDETNEVLDERFGDRRVDVVVRHVIADTVGAPAERQFGEITGADHEAAVLVREPEQIIGA